MTNSTTNRLLQKAFDILHMETTSKGRAAERLSESTLILTLPDTTTLHNLPTPSLMSATLSAIEKPENSLITMPVGSYIRDEFTPDVVGNYVWSWRRSNETLKMCWRIDRTQGQDAFDPRSPAINDGKIFVCTEADTAEASDLETGKPVWHKRLGFKRPRWVQWLRMGLYGVSGYAALGIFLKGAAPEPFAMEIFKGWSTLSDSNHVHIPNQPLYRGWGRIATSTDHVRVGLVYSLKSS